ncbi:hypothetical protein [Geobacter sp. AOG1]|uniref:hypothetical protein n=1 Tax=Geobacter sp. AOG1 TaxID=1566346 RepID=UPI001CC4ED14|nr:hypothetical protein [Geobacter sp. AOG1]GFE56744.1 hypothetical protein AOG1_06230 [Geobacter sp. AOG1]
MKELLGILLLPFAAFLFWLFFAKFGPGGVTGLGIIVFVAVGLLFGARNKVPPKDN